MQPKPPAPDEPDEVGDDHAAKETPAKPEEDPDRDLEPIWEGPLPSRKLIMSALEAAFAEENDVPAGYLERCADHAELLLDWNQRVNLTAITSPEDMAVKHYLDCWKAARLLPLLGRKVLDLGSGGGFPGIPVALAEPNCSVTLCESRGRRVRFLEAAVASMALPNVSVVEARGEDHLGEAGVDVVMARALSSVRETVRLLRKVRHRFNELILFKGATWSREMRAGEREAQRLGFHFDTVVEYELPKDAGKRALLIYRAPGGAGR
jgi:16S rRNA (guanine527-N7)-methyltransferase